MEKHNIYTNSSIHCVVFLYPHYRNKDFLVFFLFFCFLWLLVQKGRYPHALPLVLNTKYFLHEIISFYCLSYYFIVLDTPQGSIHCGFDKRRRPFGFIGKRRLIDLLLCCHVFPELLKEL